MERSIIFGFCTYSSKTIVLPLSKGVTFIEFVGKLTSRWTNLLSVDFGITYSVMEFDNILLETDLDVDVMISHHIEIGAQRIDIKVFEKNVLSSAPPSTELPATVPPVIVTPNHEDSTLAIVVSRPNSHSELISDRWSSLLLEEGQVFHGGSHEFRMKLKKYAIEKGFNYIFLKNDLERVTAKCDVACCTWLIHARSEGTGGVFYLKRWINDHTCNGGLRTVKHDRVSSSLISDLFNAQIRSKPSIRPIDLQDQMKTMYGLDVSYFTAWKGKEKALGDIQGEEQFAFDRLRSYEAAINRTNPGSYTSLEYDQNSGKFQRIFIAFSACIEGFKYCRPIIFLDGTFLKGKYKGILLAATGKNGDKGQYPLCFGIVDIENERNWLWFLQKLAHILDPHRTIVFISDRNKGLLEAVSVVFPSSPHGFCMQHLKQNLRRKITVYKGNKFREKLVKMFWRLAAVGTHSEFLEDMALFRSEGGAYISKFLEDLPVVHWANAFFPGCRYGELTSNMAESFNSWIKEERNLPIDMLVDFIRRKLMVQMAERLQAARDWTTFLCPKMEKLLQDIMREGCNWKVIRSSDTLFEVHSTPICIVDLHSRSCSCRAWDILGFPCGHALAAIQFNQGNVYDYCEHYWRTETFIDSYSRPIYPITVENEIVQAEQELVIKPPDMKRPAGRPKRKRGESKVGQFSKTIRCTRCKKLGYHNRRSCKEPI